LVPVPVGVIDGVPPAVAVVVDVTVLVGLTVDVGEFVEVMEPVFVPVPVIVGERELVCVPVPDGVTGLDGVIEDVRELDLVAHVAG
jgi:hypothetical protein